MNLYDGIIKLLFEAQEKGNKKIMADISSSLDVMLKEQREIMSPAFFNKEFYAISKKRQVEKMKNEKKVV